MEAFSSENKPKRKANIILRGDNHEMLNYGIVGKICHWCGNCQCKRNSSGFVYLNDCLCHGGILRMWRGHGRGGHLPLVRFIHDHDFPVDLRHEAVRRDLVIRDGVPGLKEQTEQPGMPTEDRIRRSGDPGSLFQ